MHRILVVDDEPAIRGIVEEILAGDGHAVETACSAEEALARLADGGIDLVITDIRMGGMDGLSMLRKIRSENDVVQVVIMTSHACTDSAVAAVKLGAYDYLTKPFESLDAVSLTAARALEEVRHIRERELMIATLARNNEKLSELNKFFRDLAIRDGLTNLYNHRHLQEAVHAEVERARKFSRDLSMLFIDVDHFKTYNDLNGHQSGDDVLRHIAQILGEKARDTDIVARWGGEEFVVLAPETSAANARQLGEDLRASVAAFPFPGRETQPNGLVTISVGVATLNADGTHETLVGRADRAVYEAKSAGRNTVCVAA